MLGIHFENKKGIGGVTAETALNETESTYFYPRFFAEISCL